MANEICRPVEIHELQIKPADFFAANPSIDVPSNRNLTSKLVENESCCHEKVKEKL
jgi:primary-amine oxidase